MGDVIEFSNCKLEGTQSVIVGRVMIHTSASVLINEAVVVKIGKYSFNVLVKEEVRDIVHLDSDENEGNSDENSRNKDENPWRKNDVGESDSIETESRDEEQDENMEYDDVDQMAKAIGNNVGKDEAENAEDQQSGFQNSRELNVEKLDYVSSKGGGSLAKTYVQDFLDTVAAGFDDKSRDKFKHGVRKKGEEVGPSLVGQNKWDKNGSEAPIGEGQVCELGGLVNNYQTEEDEHIKDNDQRKHNDFINTISQVTNNIEEGEIRSESPSHEYNENRKSDHDPNTINNQNQEMGDYAYRSGEVLGSKYNCGKKCKVSSRGNLGCDCYNFDRGASDGGKERVRGTTRKRFQLARRNKSSSGGSG